MLVLCRKAGESSCSTRNPATTLLEEKKGRGHCHNYLLALREPAAAVLLRSLLRREPALVLSVRLDFSTRVEQHRATAVSPSALRPPF